MLNDDYSDWTQLDLAVTVGLLSALGVVIYATVAQLSRIIVDRIVRGKYNNIFLKLVFSFKKSQNPAEIICLDESFKLILDLNTQIIVGNEQRQ